MRYVTRRGRFYKIDSQGNRTHISKEEWLLGKNVNTTPTEDVHEEEVKEVGEEATSSYEQEIIFESESGSEEEI